MIRASLAVVPARLPMLWAKLAVCAGAVFLTMLVSSLTAFTIGQALLSRKHLNASPADPGALRSIVGAALYLTVVIGNWIGGWIAAELALLASDQPGRRISSVVLVDAVGLQINAHPIADFFSLTMDQVTDLSYHDPAAFRIDLPALTGQQKAAMAANRATLQVYGGTTMADPGLRGRLPAIAVPTLAIWGAGDRIVPPGHGHAYADAIPGATFHLITGAGHLPQLETPGQLAALAWKFADAHATHRPVADNTSAR
jgi:pimeloyl-ACP methyl ester carboxylesterase